jgi:hypothetical protein
MRHISIERIVTTISTNECEDHSSSTVTIQLTLVGVLTGENANSGVATTNVMERYERSFMMLFVVCRIATTKSRMNRGRRDHQECIEFSMQMRVDAGCVVLCCVGRCR